MLNQEGKQELSNIIDGIDKSPKQIFSKSPQQWNEVQVKKIITEKQCNKIGKLKMVCLIPGYLDLTNEFNHKNHWTLNY